MAPSDDIVNFDIIEAQKENIQALPSGRSARKLAEAFSPSPLSKVASPSLSGKLGVNDSIRAEYEAEVDNILEADDPLDVFERYVKWTFDAYPSAQATPQSQLHTLLERATKTFINSPQYKNDPRYLKLWMLYIQFFADTPRETFLFLSRHSIGESLALFYEEYAAWLEGAGRWAQAEEVYKLGIERDAKPQARLLRKFKEFEDRKARRPEDTDEPTSPALPTVRAALATKVDPFAAARAAALADPQAPAPSQGVGGTASKPGKAKMAIFSDAGASAAPALSALGEGSKGWDTIDSLANRKKENVMEPKAWAGETLKAGGKKSSAPKMQIFKDQSKVKAQQLAKSPVPSMPSMPSTNQIIYNSRGKPERVYVNLLALYPMPDAPGYELDFEEVWAMNRGWLDHSWEEPDQDESLDDVENLGHMVTEKLRVHTETVTLDENGNIKKKDGRPKKKKMMEVNETQIIKVDLDAEPKGKMKKKKRDVAEPTMTLHTRAATDDIYDIFNQPLPKPAVEEEEEAEDSDSSDEDYESDGDYDESGADSTILTTRHIDIEPPADDLTETKSVSEWSDFSTRRHIPDINGSEDESPENENDTQNSELIDTRDPVPLLPLSSDPTEAEEEGLDVYQDGFDEEYDDDDEPKTRYIPIPPEDYEPRTRPFRDPAEMANNRLPFMTPITERTETSLGFMTANKGRCYSPILSDNEEGEEEEEEEEELGKAVDLEALPSSPLKEVINEARPIKVAQPLLAKSKSHALMPKARVPKGPIITDAQCNPVDDAVRDEILKKMHPSLDSYPGFFNHQGEKFEKGSEIRKAARAMKAKNSGADRTSGAAPVAAFQFPDVTTTYTVRRELGAGAFAPVYLVENSTVEEAEASGAAAAGQENGHLRPRAALEALKMEQPPSPWEFHMMRVAHTRLGPQDRAAASLSYAHEMHLYQDEGFLFLPFHQHGSVLDVINLFRTEPSGVMDEQLAMFFTIEMLRTVEGLHKHGVLHGDLKPDNCLLRLDAIGDAAPLATQYRADGTGGWAQRGVVLIDFGRAIDMRNFAEGTQFVADWKTTIHDCAEMREGRPWTWQIDYHGLAGVIYCLLFGKYIETVRCDQGGIGSGRRYRTKESLKRYWQTDIWGRCFDLLLNPGSFVEAEEGAAMPVSRGLREVRETMEQWLEKNCEKGLGLKSLVGKVEAHARAKR